MDPDRRAAIGLALAGVGFLYSTALAVALFPPADVAHLGLGAAALGLLVAAYGVAALRLGHGLTAACAGLVAAAAGRVVLFPAALGFAGLSLVGIALVTVGLAQAAWFAVLWWANPDHRSEARADGIRLSLGVAAVGSASFLLTDPLNGIFAFLPGDGLAALGFGVAASSRGLHLHHLAEAEEPGPRSAPGG